MPAPCPRCGSPREHAEDVDAGPTLVCHWCGDIAYLDAGRPRDLAGAIRAAYAAGVPVEAIAVHYDWKIGSVRHVLGLPGGHGRPYKHPR